MNSYIYQGQMTHRRYLPKEHFFSYDLSMLCLDLDEINTLINKAGLWGRSGFYPAQFRRSDYHGDPAYSIKESIKQTIKRKTGYDFKGKVNLITHARYFGILFNPVSFYYCYNEQGELNFIVSEITNTPWLERHAYVHDCINSKEQDGQRHFKFSKDFHVSPFFDMDQQYDWRFSDAQEQLNINMSNTENGQKVFDSSLIMTKEELTIKKLNQFVLKYPFMTVKVIWGIYWQALRLKLKKTPFYIHPKKRINQGTKNYGEL